MDEAGRSWLVLMLILTPVFSSAWREPREPPRDMRRPSVHYHSKRHMMVSELESKKRSERTTAKPGSARKKPSGHLTPLLEDDMENDEVVSVAIGPPPMRPKFDKHRKPLVKPTSTDPQSTNSTAVELVKQVLAELGRELLTKDLNENFVFGQYVGNSMRNLTTELRLKMQHEVLDLIVKYQTLNLSETNKTEATNQPIKHEIKIGKIEKIERKFLTNETDEPWPDFTNLAKLVG